MLKKISLLHIIILFNYLCQAQSTGHLYHKEMINTSFIENEQINIKANNPYIFSMDMVRLANDLDGTYNIKQTNQFILITLPLPDGGSSTFKLVRNKS